MNPGPSLPFEKNDALPWDLYEVVACGWNILRSNAVIVGAAAIAFLVVPVGMPGTAFGFGGLAVSFPGSGLLFALVIQPVLYLAAAVAFLRATGRGALADALPHPVGFGPVAYRDKSLRLAAVRQN
jgi:hypothetical protein